MRLQIHRIILWPQRPGLVPRVIPFSTEQVNVITGQSQTGKSSLISIVDYALGSGKCAIPVGRIRDLTAWFGVMLKTSSGYLTLARKTPGNNEQSGSMFVRESTTDDIPPEIAQTGNVEDVKAQLDRIANLPALAINPYSDSGFDGRPSFRDMAAFNFQPQHIVANPYTLFFKADTEDHRRKLVSIFPFVLGVIDAEHLMKRRQLQDLEHELRRLEQEWGVRQEAVRNVFDELQSQFARARELGIVPSAEVPEETWRLEDYVRRLREGTQQVKVTRTPLPPDGGTDAAVRQLLIIRSEEVAVSARLGRARRKLTTLEQVRSHVSTYGRELGEQVHRLDGIGWFKKMIGDSSQCPLCGTTNGTAKEELAKVETTATEVQQLTAKLQAAPFVLDEEVAKLRSAILSMENSMRQIRRRAAILEDESAQVAALRQTTADIFRVIGQIEQSLTAWEAVDAGGDLSQRITQIRTQRDKLRKELNPQALRDRERAAQAKVSDSISEYAKILQLERQNDVATISIGDLAVRIESSASRRDYLWEIGSGANHMGYHLAALLSLHELFLSLPSSAVPSFIMIDQPSQVYFPERWPGDPTTGKPSTSETRKVSAEDEDIAGVNRIFKALTTAVERTNKRLQIIVTDHAGAITWTGLEVNVVAEWRTGKGDFLIPDAWLV